jgi:transcriptional regulator with XRE-family HTH domain
LNLKIKLYLCIILNKGKSEKMSNELGQWIERERKKRGWSQRRLAQEAGISQAPISRIINKVPTDNKEQICGEKVARALASAFGANPIYVFRLARILKTPPRSRNFSTWLVGELLLRGVSQEELSKRADLDADLVADLTRGVPPTFDIAQKLAEALELDELYIQQLAGLVPPGEQALSTEEIHLLHDYRELNNAGRKIVRDMVTSVKENME